MRPILFSKNSTSFNTNGIGRLEPMSCYVTEERNSIFELEMTVKMDSRHFSDIVHSAVILAKPSPSRNPQPFRIYGISKPINGKVSVRAEHLSYQLNYIPVMPFSAQGVKNALNGFKTSAAENCPFTFWTDLTSTASYAIAAPESIRHYLGGVRGSILDVYGGEYEWDNYVVKLHKARGVHRGVTLRYSKNITNLEQEENIANTYTGICPYWRSDGLQVTLPEKVLHSANASNFPYQRTVVKDFSSAFQSRPTVAQLRNYANAYMQAAKIGVPKVSIKVTPVDLSQSEEYKSLFEDQIIELCDYIDVDFEKLGVHVTEEVTRIKYDVLNERYVEIDIGDVRSSLARTIEDQMDEMSYLPTADDVQNTVDRATGVLVEGDRGHMIINRSVDGYANEALFMDNTNFMNAQRVLRINMNGIGFSSSGINGPYHQAWLLDGTLSLGGINNAYGNLVILDSSGKVIGRWNKDGIYANGGSLVIGKNFSVDTNGNLKANNGTFNGGTITIGNKFKVDANGNLTATDGKFTGSIESGSEIKGSKILGSTFGTPADGFYVTSNNDDENVVGCPGWTFEDKIMYSDWFGDVENPASNGDTAGINGRTGNAGFRKLYLLDGWYEGSDGSMWDVTRTIRWLDNRLRNIEDFCASHNWDGESGGDDGDDPGSGGDGYLDDGPVY